MHEAFSLPLCVCLQSVKKEAEMLSKELGSSLLVLRRAIYDEYGVDRDVLKDFSALAKYKKNGLNVHITFHALPLPRVGPKHSSRAKRLIPAYYSSILLYSMLD